MRSGELKNGYTHKREDVNHAVLLLYFQRSCKNRRNLTRSQTIQIENTRKNAIHVIVSVSQGTSGRVKMLPSGPVRTCPSEPIIGTLCGSLTGKTAMPRKAKRATTPNLTEEGALIDRTPFSMCL